MVYFMVVPGGWIADNILGHQKAVLIGAIIIAIGHFTLAIPLEQTFFLGLIFVVLGTGLLKGNISTIVGNLYSDNDERRDSGYTIFYMSINIGSTLGFLICSLIIWVLMYKYGDIRFFSLDSHGYSLLSHCTPD